MFDVREFFNQTGINKFKYYIKSDLFKTAITPLVLILVCSIVVLVSPILGMLMTVISIVICGFISQWILVTTLTEQFHRLDPNKLPMYNETQLASMQPSVQMQDKRTEEADNSSQGKQRSSTEQYAPQVSTRQQTKSKGGGLLNITINTDKSITEYHGQSSSRPDKNQDEPVKNQRESQLDEEYYKPIFKAYIPVSDKSLEEIIESYYIPLFRACLSGNPGSVAMQILQQVFENTSFIKDGLAININRICIGLKRPHPLELDLEGDNDLRERIRLFNKTLMEIQDKGDMNRLLTGISKSDSRSAADLWSLQFNVYTEIVKELNDTIGDNYIAQHNQELRSSEIDTDALQVPDEFSSYTDIIQYLIMKRKYQISDYDEVPLHELYAQRLMEYVKEEYDEDETYETKESAQEDDSNLNETK